MNYNSWAKFSFLPKNNALSQDDFSQHYRNIHGPLAADQAGFRKFTQRYEQNHVKQTLSHHKLSIDGITKTWQIEREDYSIGFFNEPDYEIVQQDEQFLLDTVEVVSVLADTEEDYRDDSIHRGGVKVLGVVFEDLQRADIDAELNRLGATFVSISKIAPAWSSALGYGEISFEGRWVFESWFPIVGAAELAAAQLSQLVNTKLDMWLVENLVMFESPEQWASERSE